MLPLILPSSYIKQISYKAEVYPAYFLHAHIGHYAGLMYLGREALDAKETPVYAMPHMYDYLTSNGPWSQLVSLKKY